MKVWLRSKPESLQRKIIGFILVISFFLLALSVFIAFIARGNYEKAKSLEQTSQVSRELSQAMRGLAFERGRMNVALLSTWPISMENRNFIAERRQMADTHLSIALKQLQEMNPSLALELTMRYETLNDLRKQADIESQKNFDARDPGIAQFWLRQATGFIYEVENVLRYLGKEQVGAGEFFQYHQLMQDSLRFRNLVGYQATSFTAALVSPETYSPQRHEEQAFVKMQADSLWSGIQMQTAKLAKLEITKAKVLVTVHYYNEYRPEQELLLSLARLNQVEADAVSHLQKLSVPAFDAIFLLIDATEDHMEEYVNGMQVKAKWLFVIGIAQFIICLLVVAFCIIYFERRLFRPLQRIIHALEQLGSNQEISIVNEELQRRDEIGQINKGVQRLQASMAKERRLTAEIEHLAMTDFLTGCLNKRAFYLRAEAELSRAFRENTPTSFVFADLDNLKQLNDNYGHLIGDEAVKHFAVCVSSQCRPYDLIGRFGGDEFVFCFPQTSEKQVLEIIKRIQATLEKSRFQASESVELQLSASFGLVASSVEAGRDVEWFIHQADMALYKAKQSGKNCVMLGTDQDC